jgi:MarR family
MQLEDTIGYWLSYAQRCFAAAFFEVLRARCVELGKPYVITPPQWGILVLLSHEDGQTISALAQHLCVDGPAVTNLVKRLEQVEQCGLVERVRDRGLVSGLEPQEVGQRCRSLSYLTHLETE